MTRKGRFALTGRYKPRFPCRDIVADTGAAFPDMSRIERSFNARKVLLIVPFDPEFTNSLLPSIVATCWAFRLSPFRLDEDSAGPRLGRLVAHMAQSNFVIADLSRGGRMNMPLELGIAIGMERSYAILAEKKSALNLECSDLQGLDPILHGGDRRKLIRGLIGWFQKQLRARKWPSELTVTTDQLLELVEPAMRDFLLDDITHTPLDLTEKAQTLKAVWQRADEAYLKEAAAALNRPFNLRVERARLDVMKAFTAQIP